MYQPASPAAPPAGQARARSLIASAVLGPWLALIASRQTVLFDGSGGGRPGPELLPVPVVLGLMAATLAIRLAWPSVLSHVASLAVVTCGVALLAASLGVPFANATADYCGDFCRGAIMGRFLAFFGWPVATSVGLILAWRSERSGTRAGAADRALWSRAWILPTLILGLIAAAAWWRIVLP